jgi:hypothetical protein
MCEAADIILFQALMALLPARITCREAPRLQVAAITALPLGLASEPQNPATDRSCGTSPVTVELPGGGRPGLAAQHGFPSPFRTPAS